LPRPEVPSVAIRCRDLHKRFGDTHAVRGLDLEVRAGECYGLLGPNGAGKTTTIEILEGLQEPDSGDVEVLGMTWSANAAALRPRLGIQLQETELPDKLTVEETLRLFRSLYAEGWTEDELVSRVELDEKRRTQVRNLSGGQRQRLSLACALAGRPDILFLDEPTTGLDPQSRRHIWDLCTDFRSRGGTILLTTHFMDEAEKLCDRLAIIDHGQVLVQGTPGELIGSLGGEHVVEFASNREMSVEELRALPGVSAVAARDSSYHLTTREPHRAVSAVFAIIQERQGELTALSTHHATLDDVFLAQTGRQLRDE
jgi:ABC-2 type transport system ATP-binding protein